METRNGEIRKGSFYYKTGGFEILGKRIGGTEKTMAVDYAYSTDEGGQKTIQCIFDGKDYRQVKFESIKEHESTSIQDLINNNRIAELLEDQMLDKPRDNILMVALWVAVIFAIIISVLAYMSTGHLLTAVKFSLDGYNTTLAQQGVLEHLAINTSNKCVELLNNTLTYVSGKS
jgi:hypothetical protein